MNTTSNYIIECSVVCLFFMQQTLNGYLSFVSKKWMFLHMQDKIANVYFTNKYICIVNASLRRGSLVPVAQILEPWAWS